MKQTFLKLTLLRALTVVAFFMGAGNAWGSDVTDVLNLTWTGVTGTSYTNWTGKKATSSAVYAGNSAGGNESIQLRSNNSNSGVVTTTSGGKAKKVTVAWNSNTSSGRTLNVYGKNSAYTAATELYNTTNQGTLLGTIVCGTSTELTISDDYEYIGFRSASGAMYLTSISIVWETGGSTPVDEEVATTTVIDDSGITNTDLHNGTAAGSLSVTVSAANGNTPSTDHPTLFEWSSSDENVATIAQDGTVTLVSVGTTTITANYKGAEGTYKPSSDTYELTVTDSSAPVVQPTNIDANLNNALFGTTYTGSASGITDENPVSGTINNVTVTYAGSGNHYINDSQIRFYPSNKLTFDAPEGYNITSIVFTASSWGITVKVGETTIDSNSKTWTGKAPSVQFVGSGSSGNCQMTKAAITLEAISNKKEADVQISATNINIGETASVTTDGPAVTLASSNPSIATVDGTTVTGVAIGTVKITATWEENEEYQSGSKEFTVKVSDPEHSTTTVTFDASVDKGDSPLTKGVVTFKCSNGELNEYDQYRLYKSSTTTFSVPFGYVITQIDFTGAEGNPISNFGETTGLTTEGNDGTWTGEAMSVSFTASTAQVRATKIDVTIEERELSITVAEALSATPGEGFYVKGIISQIDEVSAEYGNATYYISADGTTENQMKVYRGKYLENADFTAEDQIQVGDEVVITGKIQEYQGENQFAQGNYLVSLTHPLKLNAKGYATYADTRVLDFSNAEAAGYTAWQVTAISGTDITFEQITGAVAAGTGVLLKGEADTKITMAFAQEGTDISETNKLEGITEARAVEANTYYGLKGEQFLKVKAGTVPAGKALLRATDVGTTTSETKVLNFVFKSEADGVNEIANDELEMTNIFNLAGQRLQKLQKGVNIVGGKKVLVK